jgi:NAD(P)H-dependent flavin oxidoreductase YrpB (nitropropane dioxygenase family)
VVKSTSEDTIRTIIYTGRPMRILKNDYALNWEMNRAEEIKELTGKGILPVQHDFRTKGDAGEEIDMISVQPLLSGQAAGAVTEILPAKEIIETMVSEAVQILKYTTGLIGQTSKNPRPTYRQAASKL